ncbi:MAG: hypothetical protein Q8P80_04570 [Candidatus Levybacteria bacterium]|nr:hypothetical protein [Candidatus Levybacteria bacterium]
MQSLLISSKDKTARDGYILNTCKKYKISDWDISYLEQTGKSIGVEDTRNMQKKLFLKPLKGEQKAFIIYNSESLTIEAQNALLKILEEPPPNTILILSCQNKDLLLPTILSRCKIIELKNKDTQTEKDDSQYLNNLISLFSLGVGGKLKLAQDVSKNKTDAIDFLEKTIIVARKKMLEKVNSGSVGDRTLLKKDHGVLTSFQKSYTIISTTNASPRLTLENLFLNL